MLNEVVDLNPDFDVSAYAAKAFGSFHDEREFSLNIWRFKPAAADHASHFRFHPAQTLSGEPDGALTVQFEASGRLEMAWRLYRWGDQVDVLAPPELRDRAHS